MPGAILAYDVPMNINAMLEKVRKGAVASFREKQIAAVLARLGGSFVEEIADIPVEAQLYGAEHLVADREWRAEKQQDMLRKFGGPLGKPGSVRIVGDFKWGSDGYYTVPCIARVTCFRISLGAHSVLLSPLDRLDKHAADALQWHKLIASPEPEIYKVLQWLDAHGWKERAAAALGVEPHLPGVPRTRANTGTCGVCFANVKLDGGRLVLHGYQRPGDGMAHGRCWGVGHEPFELSPEATRKYTDRGLTPKREAPSDSWPNSRAAGWCWAPRSVRCLPTIHAGRRSGRWQRNAPRTP